MQAGKLNQKIEIQKQVEDRTDSGAVEKTWITHATVWASVEPLAAREYIAAQTIQSEINTRIRIRYHTGITPKMRVKHRAEFYDIEQVKNLGYRDRQIEMLCVARGDTE